MAVCDALSAQRLRLALAAGWSSLSSRSLFNSLSCRGIVKLHRAYNHALRPPYQGEPAATELYDNPTYADANKPDCINRSSNRQRLFCYEDIKVN